MVRNKGYAVSLRFHSGFTPVSLRFHFGFTSVSCFSHRRAPPKDCLMSSLGAPRLISRANSARNGLHFHSILTNFNSLGCELCKKTEIRRQEQKRAETAARTPFRPFWALEMLSVTAAPGVASAKMIPDRQQDQKSGQRASPTVQNTVSELVHLDFTSSSPPVHLQFTFLGTIFWVKNGIVKNWEIGLRL